VIRAALVLLAACASSGPPICADSAFQLDGEAAGKHVSVSTTTGSFSLDNTFGVTAGALAVSFDTTGEVSLEWSTVATVDEPEPARGTVTLLDGSSYTVTAATVILRASGEGSGVSFELTKLASGAKPAGSLDGCASP
jgi:hypothetical protein